MKKYLKIYYKNDILGYVIFRNSCGIYKVRFSITILQQVSIGCTALKLHGGSQED